MISTEAPQLEWDDNPACYQICNSFHNIIKECRGPYPYSEPNYGGLKSKICDCSSACFLIWSAGVIRLGSLIGLHRPYFDKNYFSGLTADEANREYKKLSDRVRAYLKSMDIPDFLVDEMFSHSSDDIFYLHHYDKNLIDRLKYAPYFEEMLIARCPNLTNDESKILQELNFSLENLTTTEKHALKSLNEK